MDWTTEQREAARDLIGEIMPNSPVILVANIETMMPASLRRGLEKLFARLAAPSEAGR